MKKEQFKNISLAFLVLMNLLLGSNILFDKKLWPSGYNFFNIDNFRILNWLFKNKNEDNEFEKVVHLTLPEKMIFNTGDQTTRFSITSNNAEYNTVIEYCNEILGVALSSDLERVTEISREEWFSSLMTDSIYLSYYTEYETDLFANFLGLQATMMTEKVNSFSNVVISLSDNVTVYFEDIDSKKCYKIKTGRRFADFKKVVEEMMFSQNINNLKEYTINYSFDLNFDESFGEQKTIIDSMVPIYSKTQTVPVVVAQDFLTIDGRIDNNVINKIANLFHVNANTARRYTEADETVVYVENNATLKIHTNGIIEYKARDEGIKLSNSSGQYNIISQLNEFIGDISSAVGSNNNVYLSSEAKRGKNIITFDYVCEGMPVKMNIDDMQNAICCVVSDGAIIEYKHIIRNYEKTGDYIMTPEYITAVDKAIQEYSDMTGEITINKLYLAYNDNNNNSSLVADWNVDVEAVIVEDGEE